LSGEEACSDNKERHISDVRIEPAVFASLGDEHDVPDCCNSAPNKDEGPHVVKLIAEPAVSKSPDRDTSHLRALCHKIDGIRLVNTRIADPIKSVSNANMQAAIVLTRRGGNAQAAKDHLLDLKRRVAMRGGLIAFHDELVM
jgi:hypothetical protein